MREREKSCSQTYIQHQAILQVYIRGEREREGQHETGQTSHKSHSMVDDGYIQVYELSRLLLQWQAKY